MVGFVGEALAGADVVTGDEGRVRDVAGIGPLVPDGLAVGSPEFVAPDLHVHGAFVDEGVVGAIGVDHPDAVDILPDALVAVHEEGGIGGREEEMVDPVGGVEEGFDVAGLLAVGAGLEAEGEEDERKFGGKARTSWRSCWGADSAGPGRRADAGIRISVAPGLRRRLARACWSRIACRCRRLRRRFRR